MEMKISISYFPFSAPQDATRRPGTRASIPVAPSLCHPRPGGGGGPGVSGDLSGSPAFLSGEGGSRHPFRSNRGVWRRQRGPGGKTLRMARQVGPTDGSNALGLVQIGPRGTKNRAFLSEEGGSRHPFAQIEESSAASEAPAAKLCKQRARLAPRMD